MKSITCRARAVVLATGGAGELFRINYSSNVATGDGYAAAYRAGANLVGMEFTMFSPPTMMEPGLPMWYLLPCEARLAKASAMRRLRPIGRSSARAAVTMSLLPPAATAAVGFADPCAIASAPPSESLLSP